MATSDENIALKSVFDDKQWVKARDAAGLHGPLDAKVSMTKAFAAFAKTRDKNAAEVLLKTVENYDRLLRTKHSHEKYYPKLVKVVADQKKFILSGLHFGEVDVNNPAKGQERINTVVQEAAQLQSALPDSELDGPTKGQLDARLKSLRKTCLDLVVHFKLDPKKPQAKIPPVAIAELAKAEAELAAIRQKMGQSEDSKGGTALPWKDAQEHWDKVMAPIIKLVVTRVLAQHPDKELAVPIEDLFDGLLQPVKRDHEAAYKPTLCKPLDGAKPGDPLTQGWLDLAYRLFNDEVLKVTKEKKSSDVVALKSSDPGKKK